MIDRALRNIQTIALAFNFFHIRLHLRCPNAPMFQHFVQLLQITHRDQGNARKSLKTFHFNQVYRQERRGGCRILSNI